MRVCQILGGNEDGGLEKHTVELSTELSLKGIDVTIIAHPRFAKDFKSLKFIPLDLAKGRYNPWILFQLYRVLKKENFDIVHTQANKATAMVAILKPFLSSKMVSTLHSVKRNLKPYMAADYVIIVSHKVGELLKVKNKEKIYNGIFLKNIDEINLHQKYHISQEFVICAVGRLSEVKRFDVILSALPYLEDVHVILVGDGREEEKLLSLAKQLDVEHKVTFTGVLDNEITKSIIKSSDLFVLSSDKEGFPYVIIEALCYDTPILSTDVSDIRSIVGDAYIIPFSDEKALAKKIIKVKEDYIEMRKVFEPIFTQAKEEFQLSTMTKKTILVYQKVLV